jgi:hypothetical protein
VTATPGDNGEQHSGGEVNPFPKGGRFSKPPWSWDDTSDDHFSRRSKEMKRLLLLAPLFLWGCGNGSTPIQVPEGEWGGQNMDLVVTTAGATSLFKCGATGLVSQPIVLDSTGHFQAQGTFTPLAVQSGPLPALYAGSIAGIAMTLSVTVGGAQMGPFQLVEGRSATIDVCNF